MKLRNDIRPQHVAGDVGYRVKSVILSAFFRVFPCASVAEMTVFRI